MDLNQARKKIEEIDAKMASLFEQRMHCSKEIAEYKIANDMRVFDVVREKKLLDQNSALIEDKELETYYRDFLRAVMNISKDYQRNIMSEE